MLKITYLIILLMGICLPVYAESFALADTLTQPDTTTVISDTTEPSDNDPLESVSEDFGNRLKSQLNLSDDQTSQVKSVISSYIRNYDGESESAESSAERIAKILNETQRGSWDSVKDAFWSDLNRRISDEKEESE